MYDDASEQSSNKAPESSSDRPVRFSMVFPESLPMNSMSDCGVTFGKGPGVSEFTRMSSMRAPPWRCARTRAYAARQVEFSEERHVPPGSNQRNRYDAYVMPTQNQLNHQIVHFVNELSTSSPEKTILTPSSGIKMRSSSGGNAPGLRTNLVPGPIHISISR